MEKILGLNRSKFLAVFCVLATGVFSPLSSRAADFVYHFDNCYSGTPPEGTTPWVDALFETVTPGTVRLTLSNVGLTGVENLHDFYFNLDPSLAPTSLTFNDPVQTGSFTLPLISQQVNGFKADGDGNYDVWFDFATANPDQRFVAGQSLTYDISGIAGLTAADFAWLSSPAGGHGPFYAAADVQQIGGSGGASGWINPSDITYVPEPASALLCALAGGLWLGSRLSLRRARAS